MDAATSLEEGIVVVVAAGNEGQDQWQLDEPRPGTLRHRRGAADLPEGLQHRPLHLERRFCAPLDVHGPGFLIIPLRTGSWSTPTM